MNRWALRVAAYAGLMTDRYPPFRLDMGGAEPGGVATLPPPPGAVPGAPVPAPGTIPPAPEVGPRPARWTGGRITALVIGSLLALISLGLLGGGVVSLWADATQRDDAGYLVTPVEGFSSQGSALVSDRIDLGRAEAEWLSPGAWLGDVRIRVTPAEPGTSVFVGMGPTGDVTRYLDGVRRTLIEKFQDGGVQDIAGTTPATAPEAEGFWVASAAGTGTQTLEWEASEGSWSVVVMNADGGPGIDVRADVGATIPALVWIAVGLLVAGVVFLAGGTLMIVLAVIRASRSTTG